jgi:hypothetical protein
MCVRGTGTETMMTTVTVMMTVPVMMMLMMLRLKYKYGQGYDLTIRNQLSRMPLQSKSDDDLEGELTKKTAMVTFLKYGVMARITSTVFPRKSMTLIRS